MSKYNIFVYVPNNSYGATAEYTSNEMPIFENNYTQITTTEGKLVVVSKFAIVIVEEI